MQIYSEIDNYDIKSLVTELMNGIFAVSPPCDAQASCWAIFLADEMRRSWTDRNQVHSQVNKLERVVILRHSFRNQKKKAESISTLEKLTGSQLAYEEPLRILGDLVFFRRECQKINVDR